jgi:hypothetical protein
VDCPGKRRNGRLGICRCWFEKRFGRYTEIASAASAIAQATGATAPGTVAPGARVAKKDWRAKGGQP